jgi:hypothetical protein
MNRATLLVTKFNYILPDEEPKKKPRTAAPLHTDDTVVAVAIAGALSQSR